MLIYANHLKFTGADAPQAVLKSIGAWLKEQLGYGPRPDQLRVDGKEFRGNGEAGHPNSYVRVHAARDTAFELCSWTLKHPDEQTSGRQWVTDVGYRASADSCEISCVVRTEEMSALVETETSASQPRVVAYAAKNIEALHQRGEAADFASDVPGLKTWSVGPDNDSYLALASDIHRSDRNYPIVLVSDHDGRYLVNSGDLRRKLLGLAQIFLVAPGSNSFEMADVIGKGYSAWSGAINVIDMPFSSGVVRYRLFKSPEIEEWGSTQGDRIARILAQVTHNTNIPRLRSQIRPEDVTQARHRLRLGQARAESAKMIRELEHATAEGRHSDAEYRAKLEKILETREKELAEQEELAKVFATENEQLKAEQRAKDEEIEGLQDQCRQLEYKSDSLRKQFSAANRGGSNSDAAKILEYACSDDWPPSQCLEAIAIVYPEQSVILKSALRSARKLPHFGNGMRLLDMLRRLVTDYRAGYLEAGDTKARKVFTSKEYSARESEMLNNNKELLRTRTFDYDGRQVVMLQHLKVGIEADTSKTIRVHFAVEDGKIVIGHCGEHLPIPSR